MERREKAREKKALIAAKIENSIEMEIMNRVKQGVYGDRYKFKDEKVFEKALVDQAEEIEEPVAGTSKGKKRAREVEAEPIKLASKYVPDIEDLDNDFTDGEDDDFWASEDEEWEKEQELKESTKNKRKKMLTVEYEE